MKQEDSIMYSKDLLPTSPEARTWKFGHYFSIWMGSVHNVPSYVTIGGFFALGLSIWQVFFIIILSALILAAMMILNGHAGGKYGIPFSILIRSSFGRKGATFPGILRGVVAAIMWFGLQTYAGSLAVTILIGEIWAPYPTLGANWSFLGLSLSSLISLLLFWIINVLFIFTGIKSLGRLTKLLSPLVFVVFGGMAIWAIHFAGGITPILNYRSKGVDGNSILIILSCISAILASWVAQILSVSDVTRYSRSNKEQFWGQAAGLLSTYLLFAIASITIIIGSEVAFGVPIWNVLEVIDRFDSKFAIVLSLLTICLSTLSVNIVGNIIPAGSQLAALLPKSLNFKSGAILAALMGLLIMPWKLMENPESIFTFLNMVGGMLSPVIGVMLVHYFLINKKEINLQELYSIKINMLITNEYHIPAILSTLLAGSLSLLGKFIPSLEPLYRVSWFSGILVSAILYLIFYYLSNWFIARRLEQNTASIPKRG
ncbi:NCS1 family nucleobase:cation symporter [Paenibacillus sp. BSR1-1]|uniref:NCS1 family nucleobase:cation symporter n=1 Tax=Paenibacillus sp. BSR1-1 TaxID=3020845 RepID=UPI0025B1D273|nr:NCS1 family nucleobase:cation symporter [Paenibacillus sp. BSR1-1]MDN3017019.1 NCS1 family nucleobase:cation symporter [Paenibacillus sp. BSR1-1]